MLCGVSMICTVMYVTAYVGQQKSKKQELWAIAGTGSTRSEIQGNQSRANSAKLVLA